MRISDWSSDVCSSDLAKPLLAHFDQGMTQGSARRDARYVVAAMHHIADLQQQLPAQIAGRVRAREIVPGETPRIEQGYRQRLPLRPPGTRTPGGPHDRRHALPRHTPVDWRRER